MRRTGARAEHCTSVLPKLCPGTGKQVPARKTCSAETSQPERAAQPADWNDVTETISNLVDPKPGVCYVVRNRISGRVLADRQNQVIYFPDVATAYNYLDRHYQCGEAYRLERRYL